ncbi:MULTISPECIES: aldehyde dehydrogenase family protein [unclassified Anaerobiospirillum]|uniref:aldehyde dehydrogenase family protein n=1 Tax=unclassified Anaerobiospirillum TaxID=2647410 RepID=UPI001FF618A1|nr:MULTISPECIES: aldehyde dehydrogenase family protein [unclassified Anaerobiospirillum]MCK0535288.1 aldehyde dehydrogenase family protein [Anaerobiospirillum sp. NML120511]MCK0540518.1 aldehyde dehydrogenase family protein [Anaerobiospirillum sp. NML02-A-032]
MNKEDVKFQECYKLFIGGQWVPASDGATLESRCPADGSLLAKFADASKEDVDAAVAAATKAFETWSKSSARERADVLNKVADIIDANAKELALIETLDNGKPIRETLAIDIPYAARHFRYFAGVILAESGESNILDNAFLSVTLREPIGVVGQIVPWNFPFLMAAWKLAPVLAAGDCTVFKPSSTTSLSVLRLAELVQDVIPAGVFNVVTGRGSKSGDFMLRHKGFAKLAFTGSTEIGRDVAIAAAERLIPATLELGGKSANIIFDDCRMEQALDGATLGILFNQGQVCCAGSRIFVQKSIWDKFVPELIKRFESVKVGLPWKECTMMGAQIDEKQLKDILEYVRIGKEEDKVEVLTGGERITEGELANGCFLRPTLLKGCNKCRVAQEEIFGPVAVVIPFETEEEVIAMANDSIYGLGGAVFSTDINRAIRVARSVQTGRMWVNTYNQIPEGSPFGGYKESGIGRETDKMVLNHYTQCKNILINLSTEPTGFYPAP